jgi:hypothetical protein
VVRVAVRNESVRLSLDDAGFTSGMAKAAAATALLDRSLNDLDGSNVRTTNSLPGVTRGITDVGDSADRSGRQIDRFSGRLALFAKAAVTLGPALVPIGALAIPAVAGLAAGMGALAVTGGTVITAFQGVGDAMKAVSTASIEPTTVNLQAARLAMQQLAPEAREFVRQLQDMKPAFADMREAAAMGLFPGLSEGLAEAEGAFGRIEKILYVVGDAAGDLAADFGEGIAGPRGREFLNFIAAEVPGALTELGHTVGNLVAGMGELWMAFTPLNNDFSGWLLDVSRSFDDWAQGLSQTDGFREFVDYIQTNGPRVAEAMGAIGNAVLQIVQAAAPLGGPTLVALEAVADVIAAIANSAAGPSLVALASGLVLVNSALKGIAAVKASAVFTAISGQATGTAGAMTKLKGAAIGASVGIAAAATAGSALVDVFREDLPGVEQLTGMLRDLEGGAVGSLPDEFNSLADSIERITNPSFWKGQATSDTVTGLLGAIGLGDGEGRTLAIATDEVEALDAALANMAATDGPEVAARALAALGSELGISASAMTQLQGMLPQYDEAVAAAGNASEVAAGDVATMTSQFNTAKSAALQLKSALTELTESLTKRSALRDYEASLDDFAAALKDVKDKKDLLNKDGSINIEIPKGREMEALLDNIASSAVALADTLPPLKAARVLTQARKDIVDAARAMDMPKAAIRDLLRQLGLLDVKRAKPKVDAPDVRAALAGIGVVDKSLGDLHKKKTEPKVTVDNSQVRAGINAVVGWLNGIGDETVYIDVVRRGRVSGGVQEFASGGYTGDVDPRKPVGVVHGREFVFSAEATRGREAQLDALHRRLRGYAGGGLVASTHSASPQMLQHTLPTRNLADFTHALSQGTVSLKERLKLQEEETAAAKAHLSDLKAARSSLASTVTGNLRGDIFGAEPMSISGGDRPDGMAREDWLWLQETKAASAAAAAKADSPVARLRQQIRDAREMRQVLRKLAQRGLGGAALAEVASTASLEEMQALLAEPGLVNQFERLYGNRQQATRSAGQYAGSAVYDKRIDQQTAAVQESVGELRQIKQRLGKLEEVRQETKRGADHIVGAIKGTTGDAARRHRG